MKTSAKRTKDGYFTVKVYSSNFGKDLYEYLERNYSDFAECHVRWHSCICLLMKQQKLDPIVSHAVHMYLRGLGIGGRYNNE